MITAVLNIVIPVFALSSLIAVVYFFGRAFSSRMKASKERYSVGEFERYREMKLDIMRGVAAAIIGLIFLGVYGIIPQSTETAVDLDTEPTVVPTATTAVTPSPTVTAIIIPTMAPGTAVIFPTTTPPALEATPPAAATSAPAVATSAPAATDTPAAAPVETTKTAVVSSGVGVWLRDAPTTNSEQLEWLLEGVVLTLLDGEKTADGFEWQEVRTAEGLTGWVAVEFLQLNEE